MADASALTAHLSQCSAAKEEASKGEGPTRSAEDILQAGYELARQLYAPAAAAPPQPGMRHRCSINMLVTHVFGYLLKVWKVVGWANGNLLLLPRKGNMLPAANTPSK